MAVSNVNADSWYFNDGSTNYGNGSGPRMYVGHTSLGSLTGQNRFAIKIPKGSLFDGISNRDQISAFNIRLRVKGGCNGVGGAIRFFLERATTAMGENTYDIDCGVYASGTANVARYPGPTRDATNRAGYGGTPTADTWITVNALALGKQWFDNRAAWSELTLVAVAANDALTAYDEATDSRRVSFYTRSSASIPYAELIASTANRAPNKPDQLQTVVSSDGTLTVTARHTDPDGDTATKYEVLYTPD